MASCYFQAASTKTHTLISLPWRTCQKTVNLANEDTLKTCELPPSSGSSVCSNSKLIIWKGYIFILFCFMLGTYKVFCNSIFIWNNFHYSILIQNFTTECTSWKMIWDCKKDGIFPARFELWLEGQFCWSRLKWWLSYCFSVFLQKMERLISLDLSVHLQANMKERGRVGRRYCQPLRHTQQLWSFRAHIPFFFFFFAWKIKANQMLSLYNIKHNKRCTRPILIQFKLPEINTEFIYLYSCENPKS